MLIRELVPAFIRWCARHRSPATVAFYRARLQRFRKKYDDRDLATLTLLDIDEHLADAGREMSDSTRHHNAVALERLQLFAIEHKFIEKPIFGKLEKPRIGQRDRVPTAAETAGILSQA